jgi:hypothetical protein
VQLPKRIQIVVRTDHPISIAESTAGDQITGRLDKAVNATGLLLPKGTRVLGRIRRLEQYFVPEVSTLVGLELFAAETGDARIRLTAHLTGPRATPDSYQPSGRLPTIQRGVAGLNIEDEGASTGVGIFRVSGKELNLPRGLRTIWVTH